ncbi:Flagellar hook-associated protein FlgK [hydrothermal vent metagenome]|uniref:Flagellar hook-associated protein FlgK n=1 Tax=hydrothermal vent metagenome TaxID=652676 RepID=A0A3B0ZF61_9ZZZZ
MAGGILGSGVSALLANQRSLAVTSNNIANVNTEGYSRQRVEFGTKSPQFSGVGYIGRGVDINSIERIYNSALVSDIRNTTASLNSELSLLNLAGQLDSLVADPDAGISPVLQSFFDAVNDVADEPSSLPARQVLLSQSEALMDRFSYFSERFSNMTSNVNQQISSSIDEVNGLTSELAQLNEDIVSAIGAGAGSLPNDLLDRRDQVLNNLAKNVAVSVFEEDDGAINVFIGKGQLIVNRFSSQQLVASPNVFDPTRTEISVLTGSNTIEISAQLSGGIIGGSLDYRDRVLGSAQNALGRVAIALSSDFNAQNRLGMDLQGNMGTDFFQVASGVVNASGSNTGIGNLGINLTNSDNLTTSDYRLIYNGSNNYTLRRLSDDQSTNLTIAPGGTSTEVDGFTLSITTAPATNDTFLLQPTVRGAETVALIIRDATRVAAASPVRSSVSLNNTGDGMVSSARVTNATTFASDNYDVVFADVTVAAVGGGIGAPVENGGGATSDTLQYVLNINGVNVITEGEGAGGTGTITNLTALASAINGSVAQTGVRAYLDNSATPTTLYLARDPASAVPITVTETLQATAGAIETGDTVTGYFGSVLSSGTPSVALADYNSEADRYVVLDGAGNSIAAGTYTEGANISFNGIQAAVSGTPNTGDQFAIDPNTSGVGDNTNALILASLRDTPKLDGGVTTYQSAYSQMVSQVGATTRQAEVNYSAQDARLISATAARDGLSGVNLDEEAANILRFQQAYQAAARVISVADTLFQSLLDAVR